MPGEGGSDDTQAHVEGEERRLVAVLVGDVVGYTRLIGEDEEHTVRTLAAYQQEIELLVRQHRGRLVDFAAGDGFLAEFPSAVYAVRCGLEIQRVLRARNDGLPEEKRLEFRLGAHLGDVRVEGERLVGSGVNVAARLEPLARPGGLCVSERIREDIRGRLEVNLEDLGVQDLKNVQERLHAYGVEMPAAVSEEHPSVRSWRPTWQVASAAAVRQKLLGPRSIAVPLGAAALALVLGFLLGRSGNREAGVQSLPERSSRPATRTVVELPDSAPLALGTLPLIGFESPVLALSPDGRHLVYVGQAEEGTHLYHRDLSRFEEPRPVPGTEGAHYAFFSPSSEELGFLTEDRVRKVTLSGGAATTLCRARTPVTATWIDDTIYFTDGQGYALTSVAAGGGEPSRLFGSEQRLGALGQVSNVLPGERAALVSLSSQESRSSDYSEIWVVSLEGRDSKTLGITGFDPHYLPSGHLVFGRGRSLLAAPFDLERLELTGDAVPVLEGVALGSIFGYAHAAFASEGTVAFVPGDDLARGRLGWVDRQGNEGVLDTPERVYGVFDVAPDDQRFAMEIANVRDYVWIWDAEGGGGRALASPASVGAPVWSPDGSALAYTSKALGSPTAEVVIDELEGGAAKVLLSSESAVRPNSWSQPGRIGVTGLSGVGVLTVTSPRDPLWVREDTSGGLGVWNAALSPDASWIAYTSHEGTGSPQVWVEKVDGKSRRQVSTDGGLEPVWCRECGELFYRMGSRFLASRITLEPQLEIGPPRVVFEAPDFVDTKGISFRVSSDGERLYYVRASEPPVRDRIHIVHNWFSELRELVGGE